MPATAVAIVVIAACAAVLTGCGKSGPISANAYGTPNFKITINGSQIKLDFDQAPPINKQVTIRCGDYTDKGYQHLVATGVTWYKGFTEAETTMPKNVENSQFCDANLGGSGNVIAFFDNDAKQRFIADQRKAAQKRQQQQKLGRQGKQAPTSATGATGATGGGATSN